jgi:hypothetical protein
MSSIFDLGPQVRGYEQYIEFLGRASADPGRWMAYAPVRNPPTLPLANAASIE